MTESSYSEGACLSDSTFREKCWFVYHDRVSFQNQEMTYNCLRLSPQPKVIRVHLESQRVTFCDPKNGRYLCTFRIRTSSERGKGALGWFGMLFRRVKVFPYFKTNTSLRILPVEATVSVEQRHLMPETCCRIPAEQKK